MTSNQQIQHQLHESLTVVEEETATAQVNFVV